MNFILEGNIDFKELLKKTMNEGIKEIDGSDTLCLLTHEPLNDTHIKLSCNHSFNYKPLYDEVVIQKKKSNNLEVTRLRTNEIKCPYCRVIIPNLLPFIPSIGLQKIHGVNWPHKYCMKYWDCEWLFKSGKNKGKPCHMGAEVTGYGNYCTNHFKKVHKQFTQMIPDLTPNPESSSSYTLTPDEAKFAKTHTIPMCKQILKENDHKVGGRKAELIKRIFLHNLYTEI
jgi:hypothetical protein